MSRPTPRRGAARLLPAAALSLAVLPLVACGAEETGPLRVEVGDVVRARQVEVTDGARAPFVLTPVGRLAARVGQPLQRLDADQTRSREPVTAPEGSVLVPVRWEFDASVLDSAASVFGEPQPLDVALVSDGTPYQLVAPAEDRGASDVEEFYVAVEGDGLDLDLRVTYAGVSQELDLATGEREAGAAEGLYDLSDFTARQTDCPDIDWAADDEALAQLYFYCSTTTALRTPFFQGTWADEGHQFVVVGLTVTMEGYLLPAGDGIGSATYQAVSSRDTTTLGGRRPSQVLGETTTGTISRGFLVFDVEGRVPRELSVGRRFELAQTQVRGGFEAPQSLRIDARGQVPLQF